MIQIGIDPTDVRTLAQGAAFALGTEGETWDQTNGFRRYVYVQMDASGLTTAGMAAVIDANFSASMITTTNTAAGTGFGKRVGIAAASIGASGFGWLQIYGKAAIRVLANAAAWTRLNTTATAGVLDDDGTASSRMVDGVYLQTANGGATANANGFISYPLANLTL